jgi:MFS family permease
MKALQKEPRPRGPLLRYLAAATLARTVDEGGSMLLVSAAVLRSGGVGEGVGTGALVTAALLLPQVLAGPLVGAAVSRAAGPRLLHAVAVALFGTGLAAAILLIGRAPVPVAMLPALLAGACGPMLTGGMSGLLDELLPERQRPRGRGLDAAAYNVAGLAGPAGGAMLVAAAGTAPAAAVVLAGCGGAALLVFGLPSPAAVAAPAAGTASSVAPSGNAGGLLSETRAGLRHLLTDRPLRAATAATTLAFLGIGALTPIAVLLGRERLGESGGGLLMTAFAVGALLGSLAFARRPPRSWPAARLVLLALLGHGLALGAAAAVSGRAATLVLFGLAGALDGPMLALLFQVRSERTPARLRSQIFVLGAGVKITAASLGAVLFGLLGPLAGAAGGSSPGEPGGGGAALALGAVAGMQALAALAGAVMLGADAGESCVGASGGKAIAGDGAG